MSGARLLTTFGTSGALRTATGQDQSGQVHGPCTDDTRCDRPEDLFIDDVPLLHVASRAAVTAGKWFFDYDADTIYFADDPTGHRVEISTSRVAFAPTNPDVTIQDLIIEKYAIPAQMGAIGDQYAAAHWTIESNEVRWNHGTGINGGTQSVLRNNFVHHNGQKGLGATGEDVLVEGNEISYNTYAHYDTGWDGGATKFAFTSRLILRGNCVHHNNGNGLWTDIDNRNALIENNTVFSNRDQGIFHEISFEAVIRNNLVGNNGERTNWLYGANILISSSQDVEVYGNTVEVNAGYGHAIVIIWQNRPPYVATGNRIHDNDVTHLGTAGQSGGASDFPDGIARIYTTNTLDRNHYHVPNIENGYFGWTNMQRNFAGVRAAGQEANGTIDTTVVPRTWACPTR